MRGMDAPHRPHWQMRITVYRTIRGAATPHIETWCRGSTTDFDSVGQGSIPCVSANAVMRRLFIFE